MMKTCKILLRTRRNNDTYTAYMDEEMKREKEKQEQESRRATEDLEREYN